MLQSVASSERDDVEFGYNLSMVQNTHRPIPFPRRLLTTAAMVLTFGVGWACASMPWAGIAIRYRQNCTGDRQASWSLCALFYLAQTEPAPDGGPQALEGYTVLQHDVGTVAMAHGTLGNIEFAGAGRTKQARSLQAGGVITGSGVVEHWSGLYLSQPQASHGATGRIERRDYITFDNGWSLRPRGEQLLICDPSGGCRAF